MCLCLGPSLFGEDRRWSYPLIRDGFSFLTCMAFFPTLYLWQKSDVDSAFNFAIIVNLQLSTQHLIDCVCNLFTVYINPLTVLQQVGAVLTSSQRTALRELFTEATHLIPSAATACGRKPTIEAALQRERCVRVLPLKRSIFADLFVDLHTPTVGIFSEPWRTEDKDRRSRRLWCSPLYPFYGREQRLNCWLAHLGS